MYQKQTAKQLRLKRLPRIRIKLQNSKSNVRLSIGRSNYALTAQLIEEKTKKVFATIIVKGKNNTSAKELGQKAVEVLKAKKIENIVFDRSGYRYHGVIKTVADTVREGGIIL
jgi:large subunit ribosomal protein L18